jgi:hypothetical protein
MTNARPFNRKAGIAALAALATLFPVAAAQAGCGCTWEEPLPGRMTGGGSIFMPDGTRVTHGFQLRCDRHDPRQNLEVNWGKGKKFHMTDMISVDCRNDPDIDPAHPDTDMDTLTAHVRGRCEGQDGATAIFTFQDAGEPGAYDYGEIFIWGCPSGDIVTYGLLDKGNHQSHPE